MVAIHQKGFALYLHHLVTAVRYLLPNPIPNLYPYHNPNSDVLAGTETWVASRNRTQIRYLYLNMDIQHRR